jgi:hypothetical protein
MEKLVTIYLDVAQYTGKGIRFSNSDLHGKVEEHLQEELSDGWSISNLSALSNGTTGGWVVVALKKEDRRRA